MSDVLNRTTKEYKTSVSTPDFPVQDWIINPDVSAVTGFETKYWTITGDIVTLMSQGERDAVDAAEAADLLARRRSAAINVLTTPDGEGMRVRQLIELFNKRDNYLINRIIELQEDLQAIKASTGGTANIRAAIRASYLPSATRPKPAAVTEYTTDINNGVSD